MIKPLIIENREDTPSVILDNQRSIFEFKGVSIPEDSNKFYAPIIDWLEKYQREPNQNSKVIFKIKYYNSSSSLHLAQIIRIFDNIYKDGFNAEIKWYHHPNDDAIKEDGEEFAQYFAIPLELIPLKF